MANPDKRQADDPDEGHHCGAAISPPERAAGRTENQTSAEGARAGKAARLEKTHVVRNSGGVSVGKGIDTESASAISFKRDTV